MGLIELAIVPREKDLDGLTVRRVLPYVQRRMVGPFIFLDHMGPAQFAAGSGLDVRPHPHIGLATVTYMFSGEIWHRDTVGSSQPIRPGAVNWMTAGRGIAHSERTGAEMRAHGHDIHGLQSWVALPREQEEVAPEFHHHPADTLPEFTAGDATLKLIAGSAYGYEAPVKIYSPLFYLDATLPAGGRLTLPPDYRERAVYLIDGRLRVGDAGIEPRTMAVFAAGETSEIEAETGSHFALLGGDPFPEKRFIWWNFVSTSEDRIVQAKEDWKAGRFGTVAGDAQEFIPLPE